MSTNQSAVAELAKKILALLPGGDCKGHGGCGKETCSQCAEAIASGASVAACPACKQDKVDEIAKIMGVESVEVEEKIAFIACSGDAAGKERFSSCKSCKEAVDKGFVRGECKSGCVGVGSCLDFCEFDAMKAEDGMVVIDRDKCTGCGACANTDSCIQNLIVMIPREATNFIPCSSKEEDEDIVRATCGYGCIACGECERACPEGAVSIEDNHAIIDYDKCVGCEACTVKCKKKIIVDSLHDLTKLKEKVAFVRCSGGPKKGQAFKDLGIQDCKQAAEMDAKAMGLCTTGCLGQGNCTQVCRYEALTIVDGVAKVDPDKCVGCKDCTYACPQKLIVMVPYKGMKLVPCASTDDYEDKAAVCDSGCVACEDCVSNCPNGAIYMENAHAVIDTDLCENCQVCQYMCARQVIKEQEVPEYNYLQREALGIREGE